MMLCATKLESIGGEWDCQIQEGTRATANTHAGRLLFLYGLGAVDQLGRSFRFVWNQASAFRKPVVALIW